MIGNVIGFALNTSGKINDVNYFEGATVVDAGLESGAFTVGTKIFGPKGFKPDFRDHLFVHEYGHYLQSQKFGPLYMNLVALPSVTDFWYGDSNGQPELHGNRWYEADASLKASKFFDEKYGRGKSGYTDGAENYFDIQSFIQSGRLSPYRNPRRGGHNFGGHILDPEIHHSDYWINAFWNGGFGLTGFW